MLQVLFKQICPQEYDWPLEGYTAQGYDNYVFKAKHIAITTVDGKQQIPPNRAKHMINPRFKLKQIQL